MVTLHCDSVEGFYGKDEKEDTFRRLIREMWEEHRDMVTNDYTYHSFVGALVVKPKVTRSYDGWACGYDVIANLDINLKLHGTVTRCTDYKTVQPVPASGIVTMATSTSVSFSNNFAYAFPSLYIITIAFCIWGRWSGQSILFWRCKLLWFFILRANSL